MVNLLPNRISFFPLRQFANSFIYLLFLLVVEVIALRTLFFVSWCHSIIPWERTCPCLRLDGLITWAPLLLRRRQAFFFFLLTNNPIMGAAPGLLGQCLSRLVIQTSWQRPGISSKTQRLKKKIRPATQLSSSPYSILRCLAPVPDICTLWRPIYAAFIPTTLKAGKLRMWRPITLFCLDLSGR